MMQSVFGASSSVGVDETSSDMLKNTPSNIRRLATEIEQYDGRQNYVAQTRSPSNGGDIRWYFCKVPLATNELAASVPQTEIVGKGHYFRFGMRDSLAIEACFLQTEEELLSSWWKEYAECSEGPRGHPSISSKLSQQTEELSPKRAQSDQLNSIEEERVGVPVKGGLYEVDLVKRHSFPVYWNGENRRVLRGHWFARKGGLDWLPLREDVAEQLEFAYRSQVWHRRTFQPSGLFAARVDLQGSTPGLHALFTGEDDTWEAWLSAGASGFADVIGRGRHVIKLRRGYAPSQSPKPTQDELRQQQEEEMDDYCSQVPVRHLVFMVHGIGQRLEKSNLVDDVGNFRHITANLAGRHLTPHQHATQRVLFIPCQWRRDLKLSGEAAVEKLTLDGVRGLRTMLSATAHDVLYYMSPIYCQDIIDSVSNQLNRLYLKFLKRNPGYDGKVSIYGHSLGSVLSYDILCHQETLSSPFPMEWMYKKHDMNEISYPSRTNVPSECNFTSNLGDQGSVIAENKTIIGPVDKENMNEDPCSPGLVEEPAESSCFPVCLPTSESGESTTTDVGCQPNDALTSDENIDEPSVDWNGYDSDKHDVMNEPTNLANDIVECSENKKYKDVPVGEKEEMIKSLSNEIDLLKAKIKEYESERSSEGNRKKTTTVTTQSDSERVPPEQSDFLKTCTPQIRYTKLEFKVDTFFAVGSPLGVFLALRNVRIGIGKGKDYWEEVNVNEEMPACRQVFNIFHPCDPVAYRIEPLVCKEFMHRRPVIIPYHRGGKRLYVGFQEFREGLTSRLQALMYHFSTVRVKVLTLCESKNKEGLDGESEETQEIEERSYGSVMMQRLTGSEDGRIDHVLQDKTFRHPYISAIGSHTNYWRDYDTALFILKQLYRDITEDPLSPGEHQEGSSKDENTLKGWSDWREVADEELPLTFADVVSIKNFSRKAKRTMKR